MKITIAYRTPQISDKVLNQLKKVGDVDIVSLIKAEEDEIIEKLQGTEILLAANSGYKMITERCFQELPSLKMITILGVGYDYIDVDAASKHNVKICRTIGANSESVAEHAWGMILDLSKRITEFEREARNTGENRCKLFPGTTVYGKTIGIVGLGEIGKRIARIAAAFNMKILGINKSGKPVNNIEVTSKNHLLQNSDIVVMACPLTDETTNFIDTDAIKKMKDKSILVNVSREPLVNKEAAIEGIRSGKLFGYGIETDIGEPIPPTDEYFRFKNILVTPHNAWNTDDTIANYDQISVDNIKAFVEGKPINVLNK